MTIQHINPDQLFKIDQLSQVVTASSARLVFISGQTAMNSSFEVIGGDDYFEQSLQALRHLKIALQAAGGGVESLVSSTVYVKNLSQESGEKFMHAMSTGLDGAAFPPHSFTMVGVQALGAANLLVEISAIAAVDV